MATLDPGCTFRQHTALDRPAGELASSPVAAHLGAMGTFAAPGHQSGMTGCGKSAGGGSVRAPDSATLRSNREERDAPCGYLLLNNPSEESSMDHVRSIVVVATLLRRVPRSAQPRWKAAIPSNRPRRRAQVRSAPGLLPMRLAITIPEAPAGSAAKTGRSSSKTSVSKVGTRIDVNADLMLWQPGGVFAARHGEASPVYGAH